MRNTIVAFLIGTFVLGCSSGGGSPEDSADSAQSGNSSPSIFGRPGSDVMFDQLYIFTPTATDSDGDPLTFQVQNKPLWATFDSATGRLSGRPSLGDVGLYSGIVLSVSDGNSSSYLPAYSLSVNQSQDGSVTLNWVAPTQNSDGSTLIDLAAYNIYYGRSSGNYDNEIHISNPSITTYVVEQLGSGTYYFAATTVNSTGVESVYSGEAIRTLN